MSSAALERRHDSKVRWDIFSPVPLGKRTLSVSARICLIKLTTVHWSESREALLFSDRSCRGYESDTSARLKLAALQEHLTGLAETVVTGHVLGRILTSSRRYFGQYFVFVKKNFPI